MSGTAADVICVEGEPGNYFTTEFHVRFEKDPVDSLTKMMLAGVGIGVGGASDADVEEAGLHESIILRSAEEESVYEQETDESTVSVYVNDRRCHHVQAKLDDKGYVLFYDLAIDTYMRNPSTAILRSMRLRTGQNTIRCSVEDAHAEAEFALWVYDPLDKLVIMDVDGTVTKSDVRGYIESVFVGRYKYVHRGLPHFLDTLVESMNVNILYLTSRPIYHVNQTKMLIENARKGDIRKGKGPEGLPAGPVFPNREALCASAYREFSGNTVEFKASSLVGIADVFQAAYASIAEDTIEENGVLVATPTSVAMAYPYVLGIGNKEKDAIAYNTAGLKPHQILIIDTRSQLVVWQDKCRDVTSIADSLDDADMDFDDTEIGDSLNDDTYDDADEHAYERAYGSADGGTHNDDEKALSGQPSQRAPRASGRYQSGTWSVTGTLWGGLRSMFAEGKGSFEMTSSGGREAGRLAGLLPEMKSARASRKLSTETRELRRQMSGNTMPDAGNGELIDVAGNADTGISVPSAGPQGREAPTPASSAASDYPSRSTTPKLGTPMSMTPLASSASVGKTESGTFLQLMQGKGSSTRSLYDDGHISVRSASPTKGPGGGGVSPGGNMSGSPTSPRLMSPKSRRFSGYEDPATLQYVEDIIRTPMYLSDDEGDRDEGVGGGTGKPLAPPLFLQSPQAYQRTHPTS